MAGYDIQTPTAGDTDWTSFEDQVARARNGIMQLSLNPITTGTTAPRIAEGSIVGISGSLYYFPSTETVTGTVTTTNTNYIMLTTSSSQITASFTSEVPIWTASKNGWYDATGGKRMVGRVSKDDSSNYSDVGLLPRGESMWDKNGLEVTAMQMETQVFGTAGSIATKASTAIVVSGFSWTPSAVIVAQVAVGNDSSFLPKTLAYPGNIEVTGNPSGMRYANFTFGSGTVTVTLENDAIGTAYYEDLIVTAMRS